jgi:hypothetical protein
MSASTTATRSMSSSCVAAPEGRPGLIPTRQPLLQQLHRHRAVILGWLWQPPAHKGSAPTTIRTKARKRPLMLAERLRHTGQNRHSAGDPEPDTEARQGAAVSPATKGRRRASPSRPQRPGRQLQVALVINELAVQDHARHQRAGRRRPDPAGVGIAGLVDRDGQPILKLTPHLAELQPRRAPARRRAAGLSTSPGGRASVLVLG